MNGKITFEKIAQLREERKKEEREKDVKRQEILKLLKAGISDEKIAKAVEYSISGVRKIKQQLIDAGETTKEEIELARARRKQEEKDKDPNRKIILEGKKAGKSNSSIAREIRVERTKVRNIVDELIEERKINKR